MKKSTCLTLLLFLISIHLRAQKCDTATYLNSYWVKGLESGYLTENIFPADSGGVYMFGNFFLNDLSPNLRNTIFTTKLNSRGTPLWTTDIGNHNNVSMPGSTGTVAQSTDGGFFVAGQAQGGNLFYGEALVLKLDAKGNLVWSAGFGKQISAASAVVATADGGCAVVGGYSSEYSVDGSGNVTQINPAVLVFKFNSQGILQWGKQMSDPPQAGNNGSANMVQLQDGSLVITGIKDQSYYFIEKLDITDGHEIWGTQTESLIAFDPAVTVTVNGSPVLRNGNQIYLLNPQDGTISQGASFGTNYSGYDFSNVNYLGSFSNNEDLYGGLINGQWMGLLKMKNYNSFEWARTTPASTSFGKIQALNCALINPGNIYIAGGLITQLLSTTYPGVQEYNSFLISTDINGKSVCLDTLSVPLSFSPLQTPTMVAFSWQKVVDITPTDSAFLFNTPVAPANGIDCYITTCCRDTIVYDTVTICQGTSYTLPGNTIATKAGVYTVDLKRLSGCDSVLVFTVKTTVLPNPNLGDDTCFVDKGPVVLQAAAPFTQSYLWQDGSIDSVFKATQPGVYWVQAKNICGTATDTVVIYPSCSLPVYVPSAFTPNGDGYNDVFRIADLKGQRLLDFSVYNRWGQCVFRTSKPGQGWDGTINGQPSPPETFVYIVQYVTVDGKNKYIKGTVVLIR